MGEKKAGPGERREKEEAGLIKKSFKPQQGEEWKKKGGGRRWWRRAVLSILEAGSVQVSPWAGCLRNPPVPAQSLVALP